MTLVLRYSARSDRGLVRQNNQDSVYAGPRLLALADGMGGHAAGEVASKLLIAGSRLGMVHVGDSRAYLFRDGVLTQITRDDTFVQSLIDEGRITEDEAASHPQRSLLLRAL